MDLIKAEKKDCMLLFEWTNDPMVRSSSFNQAPILLEDHQKWFENKLQSTTSIIYIANFKNNPIGQIRLDIQPEERIAKISYSIDRNQRGKGFGPRILSKIIEVAQKIKKIDKIYGEVKKENIASQKSFEKANYKKIIKKDFLHYQFDL